MMDAVVSRVQALARDILLIELQSASGQPLPGAAPGAHIDLHLPQGLTRQYSLTNAQGAASQASYQVAVGRDAASRGGSIWIHDKLRTGTPLRISEPRNLFPLNSAERGKVLFIGAGIGITPIYAMVQAAQAAGMDWTLLACARSGGRQAFQEELLALAPERVRFHADLAQGSPLDVAALLAQEPWAAVYACGPAGLLDALEAHTPSWPAGRLRMERFKAAAQDESA
jgi:ferredoxin-NADP reductase